MIVRIIIFIILLLTGFNNLGLVSVATAAEEEAKIYPGIASFAGCSGKDCTACHMVNLANEGITWLIGIFFVLFAVLVAIAGIRLVTAGGNPGALSSAKDSFINAIVGLIIVLSAWLIVDTVMRGLLKNDGQLAVVDGGQVTGWLAWSQVECYVPIVPHEFEVQDFGIYGMNSFQAYVYNPALSCKTIANSALPDMALCQQALSSLGSPENVYIVQNCSDQLNSEPEPSWNSVPLCGGGVSGGADKILTLANGEKVPVLSCGDGASDRRTISFLGGSVNVHKNLIASLQRIDAKWRAKGGNSFYRVTSVGGYNCRKIAGLNRWSTHSYGLAIDINPIQNPHKKDGTLVTDMPQEFVNLFKSEGWGWGGDWRSSKDAMHFSKDSGERGDMRGE